MAVEAAAVTDGLVDPCLGRALVSLGYDRDLRVVHRRAHPVDRPPPPPQQGRWREIGLAPDRMLRVPEGCTLDLGATAKAWAADLVAAQVVDELGTHVLVSLGGDVRIGGPDTPGPHWTVRVTECLDDDEGEVVALAGGGVATSSTRARRWRTRHGVAHHVLDPRTRCPTDEHWRTVTATGPTCVAANVASTAALVLGHAAVPWLERHAVAARLVHRDGDLTRTDGWPAAATRGRSRP